jgi:hypothetical protein
MSFLVFYFLFTRDYFRIATDGSLPSAMMAAPPGTIDDDELETEEQRRELFY